MKCNRRPDKMDELPSLPVRGAWIEIRTLRPSRYRILSLPVRGAWIEIQRIHQRRKLFAQSLPVRGAWIEICRIVSGLI